MAAVDSTSLEHIPMYFWDAVPPAPFNRLREAGLVPPSRITESGLG